MGETKHGLDVKAGIAGHVCRMQKKLLFDQPVVSQLVYLWKIH